MLRLRNPFVAMLAVSASACASDPPRRASALDPSNPCAPEAPVLTETRAPAAATSSEPAKAGVVYTCPMHPEVRQNAPGNCPKCGMVLVPADAGAADPHQGMQHGGM